MGKAKANPAKRHYPKGPPNMADQLEWKDASPEVQELLTKIAANYSGFTSLEEAGYDSLAEHGMRNFREVNVLNFRQALCAALLAGVQIGGNQ